VNVVSFASTHPGNRTAPGTAGQSDGDDVVLRAYEKQAIMEAPDLKTRAEILIAIPQIDLAKKRNSGGRRCSGRRYASVARPNHRLS
jgi:hypothetical protein